MDSSYTYAVGYVRALETRLITQRVFEQLINSATAGAFIKTLEATPYAGISAERFSFALAEKSRGLSSLIKKLMVHDIFKEISGLKYDFLNLSLLLTAKADGAGAEPALYQGRGTIKIESMEQAVYQDKYRRLPDYIAGAAKKAAIAYEDFKNPAFIAVSIEKEYFNILQEKCRDTKNKFFTLYSAAAADIYNLKTFFRIKRLDAPGGTLAAALAEKGALPADIFLSWLKSGADEVPSEISRTTYREIAAEGAACLREKKSFAGLEAMGDGIILRILGKADGITMGPEPVMAYFLKLEHEIKTLRIILAGIKSAAPAGSIKERICLPT